LPDGSRRVEVMLKQFKIVIVNSSLLRIINYGRVTELKFYRFQEFSQIPIKNLKTHVISLLNAPEARYLLEQQNSMSINY